MHIHDISKSADAETELLPDITGTIIIYAGAPKAQVDVTYRDTHEATITAGSTHTVGAYTGIVSKATAKILAKLKEAGVGPVWEFVYSLLVPGGSV
jgi:hypothetical protein